MAGRTMLSVGLLIGLTVFLTAPAAEAKDEVCFGKHCVEVEVVQELRALMKGLQDRPGMDEDHGMLFVFGASAKVAFWMKDTLFALDIIWLNEDLEIVYMERNVQPCLKSPCPIYKPRTPARYVLEVNANYVDTHGIGMGDRAVFKLNDTTIDE